MFKDEEIWHIYFIGLRLKNSISVILWGISRAAQRWHFLMNNETKKYYSLGGLALHHLSFIKKFPKVKHQSSNLVVIQNDVAHWKLDIRLMTTFFWRSHHDSRHFHAVWKTLLATTSLTFKTERIKQTINQSRSLTTLTYCRVPSLVSFICSLSDF